MGHTSNNFQLEALSWRAKKLGISYGLLSAQISQEEAKQIYKEFEALLQAKKKAEEERILANKGLLKKKSREKQASESL